MTRSFAAFKSIMPRRQNLEVKLFCQRCNAYTQCENFLIVKKFNNSRYHCTGICTICNSEKKKNMNKAQIALLPEKVKNAENNTNHLLKRPEVKGGTIPWAPILMGLTSLASAVALKIIDLWSRPSGANDLIYNKKESKSEGQSLEPDEITRSAIEELTGNGYIFL